MICENICDFDMFDLNSNIFSKEKFLLIKSIINIRKIIASKAVIGDVKSKNCEVAKRLNKIKIKIKGIELKNIVRKMYNFLKLLGIILNPRKKYLEALLKIKQLRIHKPIL